MSDLVTFGEAFPLVRSWQADWPMEIELITDKHVADGALILEIASAILDDGDLADLPLSEIFFSMPSTGSVYEFDFQAGVQNQLLRFGYRKAEELGSLSISRFRSLRNSGEGKTLAFLSTLVKRHLEALSIEIGDQVDLFTNIETREPLEISAVETPYKKILEALTPTLSDINKIALYLHFSGEGETPLVRLGEHRAFNVRVKMAETLKDISANELLNVESVSSPIALVERYLETLSDTERQILAKRLAQVPPSSLQALGDELGVTRERVRQLESKLKIAYESHVKEDNEIQAFIWAVRDQTTQLITEKEILRLIPSLASKTSMKFSLLDFFVGLGDLEREGVWIQDDIREAISTSNAFCSEVMQDAVIYSVDLLEKFRTRWPDINQSTLDHWMSDRGYFKVRKFFMDRKTIANLVYVALFEFGKPMSGQQAMEYVGEGYNRSVEYALTVSPLFTKVTKNEWDLASRGGKQVRTIQEAIGDLLDQHGSMPLDQVINVLVEQYKFAPSSVRSYATSAPFMLLNGKVKRTNAVRLSKKSQSATRNLYKNGDAFSLRVVIDSEDLRGSGSNCPAALAAFLGVATGQSRTLRWEFGDFKVGTSGAMFNLPSIKKAADALSLGLGEQMLLTFSGEEVTFRPINLGLSGQDLARNMTGMLDSEDFVPGLSKVLGIESTSNLERIKELLAKRKEEDLLALL
jgi:hypothetical protein